MASLRLLQRTVYLHSAVTEPSFGAPTVLAGDALEYVRLWLRRQRNADAVFYWDQARQFLAATAHLTHEASPVTSYYAALNATKALLTHRNSHPGATHGVTRGPEPRGKVSLKTEILTMQTSGVLASLRAALQEPVVQPESCSLYDLLHNLPFVHRAFKLTFRSAPELFIPLHKAGFVRHPSTREVWFRAQVDTRYAAKTLSRRIPTIFEMEPAGDEAGLFVRARGRIEMDRKGPLRHLLRLTNYHRTIRQHVTPIVEPANRWYLKVASARVGSTLPLILAALHRLSELSRYEPLRLRAHLEAQHNWLIAEFLRVAPAQFMHLIGSEITGREFLRPSAVRL